MKLEGKSVFSGIAIGKCKIFGKKDQVVKRSKVTDTDLEIKRFTQAKEQAKSQLAALYEKALKEVGEANAAIFEVHQMMLDDLDYVESITNMISSQGINAEYAVATTGDNFAEMFAAMDDDYMRERAADVKDISNRVIHILQGGSEQAGLGDQPVIILADDLAPSETVQLDKSKVLSFVTRHGSTNSHTAILARTMNIPALIGVDYPEDAEGHMAVVDGRNGVFLLDPTEEELTKYEALRQEGVEKARLLQELKGKENVTKAGRKIALFRNFSYCCFLSISFLAQSLTNSIETGPFRIKSSSKRENLICAITGFTETPTAHSLMNFMTFSLSMVFFNESNLP